MTTTTIANFHLAAQRVQQRYRRMHPHAPQHLSSIDDIKHRWYWRGNAHIMRERLGRRQVLQ